MRPSRGSTREHSYILKILKIVAHFRATKTTFFQRTVLKSMVNRPSASLEFPSKFVEEHGEFFPSRCTFQSLNFELTRPINIWPISISVQDYSKPEMTKRVVAFWSGGWEKFVTENSIEIGDLLFFSLLEMSREEARFEVHIVRKPSEEQPVELPPLSNAVAPPSEEQPLYLPPQSSAVAPVNLLLQPNAVLEHCKSCGLPKPPRFAVTVQNVSLVVPGSFWEKHRKMLQSDELKLEGPSTKNIMVVEAKRTFVCDDEVVLTVCLESGWNAFVVANHLLVGESIQFKLVGPSRFQVNF